MESPRQVFASYGPVAPDRPEGLRRFCPACGRFNDFAGGGCPCGARVYANPAAAVSVLVVKGEKFALCRRTGRLRGGAWCLPCGYVGYGESFLEAARREVREECGLEVRLVSVLSVVSNFLEPGVHSLVVVLLAELCEEEAPFVAGDDADAVGWFSPDGELPPLAFEADAHIIARYFEAPFAGAPLDPLHAG